MTFKESLFNKCVYKTTLKRFKLGSFLYFILLFLCVPLPMLIRGANTLMSDRYYLYNGIMKAGYTIFYQEFLVLPLLMAFAVPTVTALLVYNYMHSSLHAVFIHSAPVKRSANFVSSALAGLTLMIVPVLLVGIILLAMSALGFSKSICAASVFLWISVNICVLFIMFSIATISAVLTGNSIVLVVINGLFHGFFPIIALAMETFGPEFLLGYVEGEYFANVAQLSPIVWLTTRENFNLMGMFSELIIWVYLAVGLALMVLACVLYKKRRMEFCSDVAGFRVMRYILKYFVTAFAFLLIFGIFRRGLRMNNIFFYPLAAVLCAVVYFACEMLIRKTTRVFSNVKGLLLFYGVMAVFLCIIAFTSFFGFETRIPDAEAIAEATIYDYFPDKIPYVSEKEYIDNLRLLHKELIETSAVKNHSPDDYLDQLQIRYNLKNGKSLTRAYYVQKDVYRKIMNINFKNDTYKLKYSGLSAINIENTPVLGVEACMGMATFSKNLPYDSSEFLNAIKKDILSMSYDEFSQAYYFSPNVYFSVDHLDKNFNKIFTDPVRDYGYFSASFNPSYENTFNLFKKIGMLDEFRQFIMKSDFLISTKTITKSSDSEYFYNEAESEWDDYDIPANDLIALDDNTKEALLDDYLLLPYEDMEDKKEYHMIFVGNTENNAYSSSRCMVIEKNKLPQYLKDLLN